MTSRATGPTRRSRTSLDRDVDETMRRRRRESLFRRRIRVTVSEAEVIVYLFGILSLIYCALSLLVELLKLLA